MQRTRPGPVSDAAIPFRNTAGHPAVWNAEPIEALRLIVEQESGTLAEVLARLGGGSLPDTIYSLTTTDPVRGEGRVPSLTDSASRDDGLPSELVPDVNEVRQEWRSRSVRPGLLKVMRASKALAVTQNTAAEMQNSISAILDKLCTPLNGKKVLDAGCGIGRFQPLFLARGAEVTGLDMTEGMLTSAPRRPGITLIQGELEDLPFKDDTYHLGLVVWVLMHILEGSRLADAANELSRCCENLLICEYVSASDPVGKFSKIRPPEHYEALFPAFNTRAEEYLDYGGDTSCVLYLERNSKTA
jgi:SAM-dependent methyltransferase